MRLTLLKDAFKSCIAFNNQVTALRGIHIAAKKSEPIDPILAAFSKISIYSYEDCKRIYDVKCSYDYVAYCIKQRGSNEI